SNGILNSCLQSSRFPFSPLAIFVTGFSLIFAGLVFEYLEPQAVLQKITKWLRMDGIMVTLDKWKRK
ncbi:MAG: hypothetical protein V3V57_10275, partial [Spirochaetia bacterium]